MHADRRGRPEQMDWKRGFLKNHYFVWISYLLTLFSVYGWYANNPFVMDDVLQVQENHHIHSLENIPSFFSSSTMGGSGAREMSGIYYKPLMTTYYALMWNLGNGEGEANAWLFRAPMFALQATNAFLIFLISLEFLQAPWAFTIGMLYQLHPVNGEMILYIADVQDVLYMFFGLLSLVAIVRFRDRSSYTLAAATFLALTGSVLSKETGVLFIPISLLWAWTVNRKALKPLLFSSITVALGYCAIRSAIGLVHTRSPSLLLHQISMLDRLAMVPLVMAHYIEILLIPIRISLGTDFVLEQLTFTNFVLPLIITLLFLYVLVFWARPKGIKAGLQKQFDFFLGVLFLWFCLHGQALVPLDAVYTDRWLPLASWACLTLAFLTYAAFIGKSEAAHPTRGVALFLGVLVCAYTLRDLVRAEDWTSPMKLYSREAKIHPWDAVMVNNVGVELFNSGNWQEAEPYFAKATELNPIWNVAWNNRGACAERHREFEQALAYYKKSYSLGEYALAYENYAKLLCSLGKKIECRAFVQEVAPRFPFNKVLTTLADQLGIAP